jgi:diguanylate cyclase (GGDEF)-like protein/PAS domain S-box-containing protein
VSAVPLHTDAGVRLEPNAPGSLRVLLIEDDPDYALLVRRRLGTESIRVAHVSTMAAAIDHVRASPVDCVLLDLSLPDSYGIGGIDGLRAVAPQMPVIVLTANADVALPLSALAQGAQDYLLKTEASRDVLRRAVRYATERKRHENELAAREAFSRAILDALPAPTAVLDALGRIAAVNRAWEELTGADATLAVGASYSEAAPLVVGLRPELALPGIAAVLTGRAPTFELDYESTLGHGEPDWFSLRVSPLAGAGAGAVVTHVPITRQKRAEQELGWLALHDQLTGIPNRRLLFERLEHALAVGRRTGEPVAVLYLDLDHFKTVNDTFGHRAGDIVLRTVAERLHGELREGDTVARLAGDELVVLVEVVPSPDAVRELAERLCARVRQPIAADGREIVITASIGVAIGSEIDADILVSRADQALYRAKEAGRDGVVLFDDAPESLHPELLAELAEAPGAGHLRLYAQPVVRLSDRRVEGHELLVRWHHPERGVLPPDHFIPEAERSGLIVPLGRWILEQACSLLRRSDGGFLSVNISGAQLGDPALVDIVLAAAEAGADLARLTVEITETAVMRDLDASTIVLQRLRDMGVRVAVDDFGAGQTSLSYLHRLPVDVLKVDRTLIARLGRDGRVRLIVTAIIELARALRLDVIVEGTETTDQERELQSLGCRLGQGFLWGRPRDAKDMLRLVS